MLEIHDNHHLLSLLCAASIACATVTALGGCGSDHKSAGHTRKPGATSAARHEPAASEAFTPVKDPAAERIVVAHIGGVRVTMATFDAWKVTLTPKTASYEPRGRTPCGPLRAKTEVKVPKKVNGHAPTPAELQRQCKEEVEERVKQQALHYLISSEAIIQEAARLGSPVTDAQAAHQVEVDKRQQFASEREFQRYLKSTRTTEAQAQFGIKAQLAEERLREHIKRSVVPVTSAQIAAYYQAHKAKYFVPERRDIQAIRTWTRSAIDKAKREILAGGSFAEIAKRISIDHPSAEHGGVTLGVTPGEEEKGFDEAIFAAKPHVLVGPLHLRQRYYIFEVNKTHPGSQKPFGPIEASITKEVEAARQQQALTRFVSAWRHRWTAKTSCSAGYVVPKCREYKGPPVEEDPYTLN